MIAVDSCFLLENEANPYPDRDFFILTPNYDGTYFSDDKD
tara:strand:- start:1664 stop:1783 length:120 start_codon:yes stop_codon:yes gene_type:complete